jgi:hypothetical protein
MDVLTNNTFGLFVLIAAPGFLSMKIWGLIHPSRHVSFADSLYEAVFYGALDYFMGLLVNYEVVDYIELFKYREGD